MCNFIVREATGSFTKIYQQGKFRDKSTRRQVSGGKITGTLHISIETYLMWENSAKE